MYALGGDGGVVVDEIHYQNAHGLLVFWQAIGRRYGTPFSLFGDNTAFWALARDERLTVDERLALLCTYDDAVLGRDEFKRTAAAFDAVTALLRPPHGVWHLDTMANDLRRWLNRADIECVVWNWTSVNDSRFDGEWSEDDILTPFSLATAIADGVPLWRIAVPTLTPPA